MKIMAKTAVVALIFDLQYGQRIIEIYQLAVICGTKITVLVSVIRAGE